MSSSIPKQELSFIADFICKKRYRTNWVIMAGMVNCDLEDFPRLLKSQSFGDDDYPAWILKFLEEIYRRNPGDVKFIIGKIVMDGDLEDALDPQYRPAFENLGIIPKSGAKMPVLPQIITVRFLDIESFPHDFYKDLLEQINTCYQYGLFPAAQVMIRKLLENCIIDILRRRYGMEKIELFYDTTKGRFRDFSLLIETSQANMGDFLSVKESFNKGLLNKINDFREQGNSSAHSINLDITEIKMELDKNRSDINFIVKSLFRTIDNLKTH